MLTTWPWPWPSLLPPTLSAAFRSRRAGAPGLRATVWIACLVVGTTAAPAEDVARAGSPGSPSAEEVVAPCPTFHWASAPRADGHEIVVYRIPADAEEVKVVLRRTFSGAIDGWTPAVGSCLERGERYAWAVRAIDDDVPGSWSPPSLFRVAPRPTEEELVRALAVVVEYLEDRGSRPAIGSAGAGDSEAAALPQAVGSVRPGKVVTRPRSQHAGTGGAIVVDGATVETKADPPCIPAVGDPDADHRFIDCGNGTVHDTGTGLIWLKEANCVGQMDWYDASAFVAQLADGQCGLGDHSQPGDWRMPTFDEWTSIFKDTCPDPEIYGRDQGCYSDAGNAWASNVQWSNEHPYSVYWSSTTEDGSANYAWGARLDGGYLSGEQKVDSEFVWAVRDGY